MDIFERSDDNVRRRTEKSEENRIKYQRLLEHNDKNNVTDLRGNDFCRRIYRRRHSHNTLNTPRKRRDGANLNRVGLCDGRRKNTRPAV